MITITFQATTAENLFRQITAFIEKMEGEKKSDTKQKVKTSRRCDSGMGEEQQQ